LNPWVINFRYFWEDVQDQETLRGDGVKNLTRKKKGSGTSVGLFNNTTLNYAVPNQTKISKPFM